MEKAWYDDQMGISFFYLSVTDVSGKGRNPAGYEKFALDPDLEDNIFPVCGKADCDHMGEDCHAFMGSFVDEINYYDHKIYYIAEDKDEIENVGRYFLWFVSEDGSRREKVAQIATVEEDAGVGFQLCVHRGIRLFRG